MKKLIVLVLLSYSFAGFANDSAAVRIGGQLEFKKTDDIAMVTENLMISVNKVRVDYTFHNDTDHDIEELIAFPIEEEVFEYDALEAKERDEFLKDYIKNINFKLNSSAKVSNVEHEIKFDKNIVHVTYHWKQLFPAGKTISVSHEYVPSGGFVTSVGASPKEWNEWHNWQTVQKDYCVEPKLNDWIFKNSQWVNQVHYILKTGANWKKPIERFKLIIKKESPEQKVSLCADGLKKINDTTFQLEKTDFLPIEDLRVLFINPAESQ
ncbi:hypothetical protein DOJK_00192 [Patescibacteria group bacterium]|nr:hypothetical protein DOJK_00192 [Patescibacteria group bacterium]